MEQTTDHDPQDGSSEEHPSLADEARAALAAAEARDGGRPTLAKTIVGIESSAINEGPPVSSGMVPGLWYPGTWQDPDIPDRPPPRVRSGRRRQAERVAPRDLVSKPRDAGQGGVIIALAGLGFAGFGIWGIKTAQDLRAESGNSELVALGNLFGWFNIGLGVTLVVLGMAAAHGGRRTRQTASVVSVGCVVLAMLIGSPIGILLTAPLGVGAYLLLRSPQQT